VVKNNHGVTESTEKIKTYRKPPNDKGEKAADHTLHHAKPMLKKPGRIDK